MIANTFKNNQQTKTGLLQANWLLGIIPETLLLL